MRTKFAIASISIAALVTAFSLVFFAEAGQRGRSIEASGTLEEERIAISIPAELALLGMDIGKGKDEGLSPSVGRTRSPKPVGTVDVLNVGPGDPVKRGDALLTVSEGLARENLKRAQARYDYTLAMLENLEGKRSDLAGKRSELSDNETDLASKRAKAEREFNAKYAEGQAKIVQMKEKLASVRLGLGKAQAGLSAAVRAENEAKKMLEDARSLPDSDPTKNQRIDQAEDMLKGAIQKREALSATVHQLSGAESELESGIMRATAGLSEGRQKFNAGLSSMNEGLVKISEGRKGVDDGISKLANKIAVLKKRRDQAEVGLAIAGKIMEASKIKATASGRIGDIKATEGSVVYPGQRVMSIVRQDMLKLNIYIPVKDAVNVDRGDFVEVIVDAEPGRVFKGTVVRLGDKAVFAPANFASSELELVRVIRVVVEVENEDGILKAGMPADVKVIHNI